MTRILCIVSAMNAGGAETFLMKLYRSLDRTRYQMDFCVNIPNEGVYDEEIRELGGRIYYVPSKSEGFFAFSKKLYRVIRDNHYENVMRVTSNGMGFYDLFIAKRAGAVNCIARSSNSSDGGSFKSLAAHKIGKLLFKSAVDVMVAPSDLAAKYTFGTRSYEKGRVHILHNGIDFETYGFSAAERERVRKEFRIPEETFVIGHIGRFTEQKNHAFLIDAFKIVHDARPDTVLLTVGDGERKDAVKEKVRALGLADAVFFSDVRKDIPAVLSAMDMLAFPSLYEGMPNVIIEAQASGLPCMISDTITDQVVLSPLVKKYPISSSADWAEETKRVLRDFSDCFGDVGERTKQVLPADYDILEVTKQFVMLLK